MWTIFAIGLALVLLLVGALLKKYIHDNPTKSVSLSIIELILAPLRWFAISPFDKSGPSRNDIPLLHLMQQAVKESQLSDFGEDKNFLLLYQKIMKLPRYQTVRFGNFGYFMVCAEYKMMFERKLRLIDYIKKNKNIEKIQIKDPVFIFGLGRNGTTLLQRLLALDDDHNRSTQFFEMMFPVPENPNLVKAESLAPMQPYSEAQMKLMIEDRQLRCSKFQKALDDMNSLGDNCMDRFHEVGANLPEECLMALSDQIPTIANLLFYIYYDWETAFQEIFTRENMIPAYRSYRQFLQVLAYQLNHMEPNQKRWILKSPFHMYFLPELSAVFPDAKLIWAHRHPLTSVTSLSALIEGMYRIYHTGESLDRVSLAKNVKALARKFLPNLDQTIDRLGLPCYHAVFDDIVKDPIAMIRSIYKFYQWDFTEKYEEKLRAYLKEDKLKREKIRARYSSSNHSQGTNGNLHNYSVEDFQLTTEEFQEDEEFQRYIKKYSIRSDR